MILIWDFYVSGAQYTEFYDGLPLFDPCQVISENIDGKFPVSYLQYDKLF